MDFIYSRLNNNLVDINRIKSITLFKCTQDNVPISGIKVGYFYLEVEVVDSDKKVYCDLSDFIDNRLPIPDQTDIAKVLTVGEDGKYQLSDIAIPTDVYTKEEVDAKFQEKLQSGVNIKTVMGKSIVGEGDLTVDRVPLADNLYSSDSQAQEEVFIERTSGGDVSIDTGTATLLSIEGVSTNPVHIEEQLTETDYQAPRFTATVDLNMWLSGPFGTQTGDYVFTYINDSWQYNAEDIYLSTYGISTTLIGDSYVDGDAIYISFRYDEENPQTSTITCDYRSQPRLEITLDRDIWVSYVNEGGTYAFYYNGTTQNWRLNSYSTGIVVNLNNYGIVVIGEPIDLDRIQVEYTKSDFGTIYNTTPTSFNSVGFNLFNSNLGYAKVIGVEDGQWYAIEGTYENVYFSYTVDGVLIPIQPVPYTVGSYSTNNAVELIESGYLHLTGTDDTTMVNLIWSGYMLGTDYQPYEIFTIDIPTEDKEGNILPAELCRVGITRDKIDFTALTWKVNVQKDIYTAQALENLISTHPTWTEGVEYEWDNNYIYYIKPNPITYNLSDTISGVYNVNDFGIEYFEGTDIPVLTDILYGQNLKDKLRTDVLTISRQELTDSQKRQVWENLGLYYVDNEEF